MKATLLTIGTAMLFTIVSVTTTAFASPGEKHVEEKGGHHEHGEGNQAGGHGGRMADVMKRLKSELGDKYNQPVPVASKEQLASGKKIYTNSCVACHGEIGKGNGPAAVALKQKPADFTDPEHSRFYSDQGRIQIIRKGSEGTAMVAWEGVLNEKEIQSVYAYVRSLRSSENEEKEGHGEHAH